MANSIGAKRRHENQSQRIKRNANVSNKRKENGGGISKAASWHDVATLMAYQRPAK